MRLPASPLHCYPWSPHVHNSVSKEALLLLDVVICMDLKERRGWIAWHSWLNVTAEACRSGRLFDKKMRESKRKKEGEERENQELWFTARASRRGDVWNDAVHTDGYAEVRIEMTAEWRCWIHFGASWLHNSDKTRNQQVQHLTAAESPRASQYLTEDGSQVGQGKYFNPKLQAAKTYVWIEYQP